MQENTESLYRHIKIAEKFQRTGSPDLRDNAKIQLMVGLEFSKLASQAKSSRDKQNEQDGTVPRPRQVIYPIPN